MSTSHYEQKDCEEKMLGVFRKNKPNQSQFQNSPVRDGLRQSQKTEYRRQKMERTVKSDLTKDYENKSVYALPISLKRLRRLGPENKAKTNQNKANVGILGNLSLRDLFYHIEIFVFKTKLKNIDFARQARYSTYK